MIGEGTLTVCVVVLLWYCSIYDVTLAREGLGADWVHLIVTVVDVMFSTVGIESVAG